MYGGCVCCDVEVCAVRGFCFYACFIYVKATFNLCRCEIIDDRLYRGGRV